MTLSTRPPRNSTRTPAPMQPTPTGPGNVTTRRSDIGLLASGTMALGLFAALRYLVVEPLRGTYLGEVLLERGWVQHAILFLFAWSIVILVTKLVKLVRQSRWLRADILPRSISETISRENVDRFIEHARGLSPRPERSLLLSRVLHALEHYRGGRNAQDVGSFLNTQGEVDASESDSSFQMIGVFIWAIPILGFIGTVIGIAMAVVHFSTVIGDAEAIGAIKQGLAGVTSGLAVAFDTTLVALIASILLMLPMHALRKAEDQFHGALIAHSNCELLPRLAGESAATTDIEKLVREGLAGAFEAHRRDLAGWTRQVLEMGSSVTTGIIAGLNGLHEEMETHFRSQTEQMQRATGAVLREAQAALATLAKRLSGAADAVSSRMLDGWRTMHGELEASVKRELQGAVEGVAGTLRTLQERELKARGEVMTALSTMTGSLSSGLSAVQSGAKALEVQMARGTKGMVLALRGETAKLLEAMGKQGESQSASLTALTRTIAAGWGRFAREMSQVREDHQQRLDAATDLLEGLMRRNGAMTDASESMMEAAGGLSERFERIGPALERLAGRLATAPATPSRNGNGRPRARRSWLPFFQNNTH